MHQLYISFRLDRNKTQTVTVGSFLCVCVHLILTLNSTETLVISVIIKPLKLQHFQLTRSHLCVI